MGEEKWIVVVALLFTAFLKYCFVFYVGFFLMFFIINFFGGWGLFCWCCCFATFIL